MQEMKLSLSLPPRLPINETVKLAIEADKAPFEAVWYGELYYNYSATVMLSTVAIKTDRIKIGLFTNPYHMNPALTSSIGCSLAEISSSRFLLGLGGGDVPTLLSIGISPTKLINSLRESAIIIHTLARGETISYPGKIFQPTKARLRYDSRSFPIFIGGQGPNMMRLSLELSDGFLLNSSSLQDVEFFHKLRRKHARKDAEIIPYVLFEISSTPSKLLLMVIARVVAGASFQTLKRLNINLSLASDIKDYIFRGKTSKAAALINQDILEEFAIVGTIEQCIERIEAFRRYGVKEMVLAGTLDPQNFNDGLERIIKQLLPSFQDS
ncbi:MAG: LLM class flavin-dependent oxidoreductase [Promethearchaeota archaeon]